MKTLTHNQPIRAAKWARGFFASTFTTAGYAAANNQDAAKLIEMARLKGHDLCSSVYSGTVMTDSPTANAARGADNNAAWDNAVVLEFGEIVTIDGDLYRVSFPQRGDRRDKPQYSNPIHFAPIPKSTVGIDFGGNATPSKIEAQIRACPAIFGKDGRAWCFVGVLPGATDHFGGQLAVAEFGIGGYTPLFVYTGTFDQANELADYMNGRLGIGLDDACRVVADTMKRPAGMKR